jgi:H+/Cl- antiporter ClcA
LVRAVEAGLAAIAYNRALLETLAAAERLGRLSVELRAGLIGAAVGTLAWFAPNVVGFGDAITRRSLAGAETLSVLPLVFLLRFWLGTVSYAAGTPGGLFAPMLAFGAARLVPWASIFVAVLDQYKVASSQIHHRTVCNSYRHVSDTVPR